MSETPSTGDLEVKEVKPIVVDTPEQAIERLRKELAAANSTVAEYRKVVEMLKAERDQALEVEVTVRKTVDVAKKRLGEISAEREAWKAKATRLETQVDAQKAEKLVAMIDERQKLRTDLGNRDKQIADLTRKVDAAQAQVEASRTLARQAEQRAQGFEASLEAMQAARDKAQRDAGESNGILAEIRSTLVALGVDMDKTPPMLYPEAIKALYGTWKRANDALHAQLEAAAKPKPAALPATAPVRKGA